MISMFTFIKNKWLTLDPVWRFSIFVYLIVRVALSTWVFVVAMFFPLVVANLDLHGEPIVIAFDQRTSERAVFSRILDGKELHFQPNAPYLSDAETGTVWDLKGNTLSGALSGSSLRPSAYSPEDIFPYRGVAPSQNILLAVWQRFDANWYLQIAQRGYGEAGSAVYFPHYPLLIHVLGIMFLGRELPAAIIISNLALVGTLYLLSKIAADLIGEEGAKRAVVFFLLFPTGFFLFAPYTESVFLFLVLASLREGSRGRWSRAGVFGALAALTRLQGVLMIIPLAYLAWKDFRNHKAHIASDSDRAHLAYIASRFAPLFLIPLAALAFLAYTNLGLLNAYESQLHARFVFPWENVIAAIMLISSLQAGLIDTLNLFMTLLFGIMIAVIWIKLPREFGLYSLVVYLAPLFRMTTEQPLVSMARYALAVFPAFILWGRWGQNAWIGRTLTYLSLPLQLYLSAQFVMWGWVG